MPTTPLFPLPEGLEMTSLSETSEELLLRVSSHRPSSLCPHCSTPLFAIHSSYRRHPLDCPALVVLFVCCSPSESSFAATPTVPAKCSLNSSQISSRSPLA